MEKIFSMVVCPPFLADGADVRRGMGPRGRGALTHLDMAATTVMILLDVFRLFAAHKHLVRI